MCDYSNDIEIIKRHTPYDNDEFIIDKLKTHGSAINVIKDFFNVTEKISEKAIKPESLNQEIYRQIREKMDIFL